MNMIVSILIPTYRRNGLLMQAVNSCRNQCNIDPADYEIVIIDNCPNKSSEGTAAELMGGTSVISYVNEPRPGVAFARNTGVAAARGDYVAFLDDDETATSNWLHELLKHGLRGGAAVFGPIRETVDDTLKQKLESLDFSIVRRFFERADGDDITDRLYDLGTGNSLFDKRQCFATASGFNERYNFVGGEDIDFLSRLRNNNVRFVWAANAWVYEQVPKERLSTRYLMQRRFHAGQVRTIIQSKGRFGFVQTALWMAIGAAQVLYYSMRYLVALFQRYDTTNYAARIAGGAGKLLFFYRPSRSSG